MPATSHIVAFACLLLSVLLAQAHAQQQQCNWQYGLSTMDIRCSVRALESTSGSPLDLQVAETAGRLELQCSQELLHASELSPGLFRQLQKLSELRIDACKLQRVPPNAFEGLMSLKRLSLESHNAVWGPGKTLELHGQSFQGLKELSELHLGDNNIRQLPEGVWCSMPSLQVLNLTQNRIRSAEFLGFSEKLCAGSALSNANGAVSGGSELQTLDVSFNELRSLPDAWGASRLRRLQTLSLQHNNISSLAPNAWLVWVPCAS